MASTRCMHSATRLQLHGCAALASPRLAAPWCCTIGTTRLTVLANPVDSHGSHGEVRPVGRELKVPRKIVRPAGSHDGSEGLFLLLIRARFVLPLL